MSRYVASVWVPVEDEEFYSSYEEACSVVNAVSSVKDAITD